MEQPRILIADPSKEWTAALKGQLQDQYTVRAAHNGEDAWELMQGFLPDMVILDVLLPGMDGISLLRQCALQGITPMVVVVTRLCSDFVISTLSQLGVSYIIPKPCLPENVAGCLEHIRSLCPILPKFNRPPEIDRVLLRLGLSRKLSGSRYLTHAIRYFSRNPAQMLTKELYGAVGQHFHASAAQVERSIRTAISRAWENRDERVWQRYFPTGADGHVRRPTNGEFISRLGEYSFDEDCGINTLVV